jgi:hypothetical protein
MVEFLTAERASAEVSSALRDLRRSRWLPVTLAYVLALSVITIVLADQNVTVQNWVIAHTSTNLHNLLGGHWSTLLSSAFVIGDTDTALLTVPLLACVLALAELRYGAWSTVRVFLAGHVGATLLVAVGLWIGVQAGWEDPGVGLAEDVGISYGAMALFGSFVVLIPDRWRVAWAMVWLAVAIEGVVEGQTFTNVGHLLSYCIGVIIGVFAIRRGVWRQRRPSWIDIDLLACATFLAVTFLAV